MAQLLDFFGLMGGLCIVFMYKINCLEVETNPYSPLGYGR